MITSNKYFETVIDDINAELTAAESEVLPIWRTGLYDFSTEDIKKLFNEIFIQFPYEIEEASQNLGMSVYIKEVFRLFYCLEQDGEISKKEQAITKEKMKNQKNEEFHWFDILDFLEEYFHRIVFDYGAFIGNTRKLHFFDEIEEEEIILKNLLKLYKGVLCNKDAQLVVFSGLRLTKNISDKITVAIIDFIEQRISMLNPLYLANDSHKFLNVTKSINPNPPISWLGTQQDLCELFYELQQKEYIPNIKEGERRHIGKSILGLFNIAATKRKATSNSSESFLQIFKGDIDKNKERTYPFLEKPDYPKKFEKMAFNAKK